MIERITDSIDKNNFGVLFHNIQTIEDFQKKSGMEGGYKVEYQHHYINLVGRIEAEGQRLDIAIPMILYNYHQEVSGAAVEFNLGEVGETNNEAMKLALEKFNEFETTDMYKGLCAIGIETWELHGMNSVHAHPSGVNRFSGTDLRANIKHPGVNFPLSIGKDVPNFASIIQHKEGFAEIIHTEYRIFNGVEKGERNYKKGRTLTIVKGVPDSPEPTLVIVEDGLIDKIFGTNRPQPPKPAAKKKRPNYYLKDGFVKEEAEEFTKEMMDLWIKCEFIPDTSMILKTNVLRGRGRLQTQNFIKKDSWGHPQPGKLRESKTLEDMNEGLFGHMDEDYEEPKVRPKILQFKDDDYESPERYIMIQFLVFKGYKRQDIFRWPDAEIENEFWNERLDEMEDAAAKIDIDQEDDTDQLINMMVADNITSREKLLMMSAEDVRIMADECYGIME